jgi:hypothetical protein
MQNRRQFLVTAMQAAAGAGVTLLLTPLIAGCGSSDNGSTPTPTTTTNPTVPGCDGAGATSTSVLGHTHTVCVPLSDLNSPPAGGRTYATSGASTDGHVHQITLSQAQLTAIAGGQSVGITTTIVESHTHDFALQEAAATTAPTPTPSPTPSPGY